MTSYVYACTLDFGVKIGKSNNFDKRKGQLQTSNAKPIELIYLLETTEPFKYETTILFLLRDYKIPGREIVDCTKDFIINIFDLVKQIMILSISHPCTNSSINQHQLLQNEKLTKIQDKKILTIQRKEAKQKIEKEATQEFKEDVIKSKIFEKEQRKLLKNIQKEELNQNNINNLLTTFLNINTLHKKNNFISVKDIKEKFLEYLNNKKVSKLDNGIFGQVNKEYKIEIKYLCKSCRKLHLSGCCERYSKKNRTKRVCVLNISWV